MNSQIFTGLNVLYTIDNANNSDSPWDFSRTGNERFANISLSAGLTYKILYPLWGYVGVGLGYVTTYNEMDEYYSSGDLYETVWMRNTDETSGELFPEGGLMLKMGSSLVLKAGIMYNKELFYQFGVGLQL